ncbi:MAG: hypothetical protein UT20_C0024G0003 [Candidatus Levybacteria bacterium GW2011_GWA1_39_11]|uniref:Uncharacterized protein n=1 Tax=Candidatus Giovannonibacteria bacterium GW2011_GWA2_45_21 TaxID=1618649 RepID=A0A0G1Q9G2_9BACT|nr:MAG: hypothetical protein UT20_C0024G0003 [Candidatus Levybacteria bacterium GW2011_GWA1_39_11]KKU05265.1 MAG: hypothetical protein UX06_C0001G0026 [Candidatus Giovannonibacteria bacterium GW2011_GWA2_45_21]
MKKEITNEGREADIQNFILKHAAKGKAFLKFTGTDKKGKSITLNKSVRKTNRKYDVVWLNYNAKYNDNVSEDVHILPWLVSDTGTLFVSLRQGSVPWMPRGTDQSVIDLAYVMFIKDALSKVNVATKQFYKKEYLRDTKKKKSAKMIVYGLKWIK